MKEIYLSDNQLARLNGGKPVILSRDGKPFLIGSKLYRKSKQIDVARSEKVKRLEAKLKALKKQGTHPTLFCDVCERPCSGNLSLALHKKLKHGGGKSNLPKLRSKVLVQ